MRTDLNGLWKTWAVLAAIALTANLSTWADDFMESRLVQISGPSPFAGCTADLVGGQGGPPILNAEVEPYLAVSPTNPNNLVALWAQDFLTNADGQPVPGGHGLVAGVSFNGGSTWRDVALPGYGPCSGGTDFGRSGGDPWLTFAPNGDLYASGLALGAIPDIYPSAVLVNKSTDGGLTWGAPTALIRDKYVNDKETLVADPFDSNFVYAAWTRRPGKGFQTMFSRTSDAGRTWEPARVIFELGGNDNPFGNLVLVLADRTLVDIFAENLWVNDQGGGGHYTHRFSLLRSVDRGQTWQPSQKNGAIHVADLQTACPMEFNLAACTTDPDNGQRVRTISTVLDAKVDPKSGNLYMVWEDGRFSDLQYHEIAFSMSTDGGFAWSEPVKVNQTPPSQTPAHRQAFRPAIAVSADGTLAVTYYDFRFNDVNPGALTDYWMVRCHPTTPTTCTNPANWSGESRLTDASFDIETAVLLGGGLFLGDYMGLQSSGNDFLAVFGQTHDVDRASIFFRRVRIAP